jgi:homoserine dehydrogenase
VDDPGIDVVIELIGGIEPARSILVAAMDSGKDVVTANKKLLAEQGADIFDLADSKGLSLGFEAAVGGGIPCVLALNRGLWPTVFAPLWGY